MAERNISPELKKNYQIVDDYCKGELKAMPDRLGYAEIYTADAMLKSLDGQRLQRLIRDIEIDDMANLAVGLSGDVRKWVFSNMSVRLAVKIIDVIKPKGVYDAVNDKSLKMARDGADAILQIFIDLSKQGEFDVPS